MKIIRKRMFDPSLEDKAEYNSLAKKNLSLSFKLLGNIFLPAIISIIPVIIIVMWFDINYSFNTPLEDEPVAVTSIPNNLTINVEPNEIISNDINGNTFIQALNKSDEISIYFNDNLVYLGKPFLKPIPYLTKKKWWNIILGSPIGYLSKDSKIDVLFFHYPEKVLFKKMPYFINGWELLFFVGIFITALPLRFIFKVK